MKSKVTKKSGLFTVELAKNEFLQALGTGSIDTLVDSTLATKLADRRCYALLCGIVRRGALASIPAFGVAPPKSISTVFSCEFVDALDALLAEEEARVLAKLTPKQES